MGLHDGLRAGAGGECGALCLAVNIYKRGDDVEIILTRSEIEAAVRRFVDLVTIGRTVTKVIMPRSLRAIRITAVSHEEAKKPSPPEAKT